MTEFKRGVWLDHICAEAYSDDADKWNLMYLTKEEAKKCFAVLHGDCVIIPRAELEGMRIGDFARDMFIDKLLKEY